MLPTVLADYAGLLDLHDRTEVRARTTQQLVAPAGLPTNAQTNIGLDLFTQPTIRVRLFDRQWAFEAAYAPSFTFPDLELGFTPSILQIGELHVGWVDRFVTVGLTQNVTYGQLNTAYFVPTAMQQPIPGQPPMIAATPAPVTVDYLGSRSALTVAARLDRRSLLSLSGEYDVYGGTNTVSRITVPQQYGPRANATYSYLVSRRDQLLTTALFQSTEFRGLQCVPPGGSLAASFACSPESRIIQGQETLRHRLARNIDFAAGVGMAAAVARLQNNQPFGTTYYPTGEAVLTVAFARPSEEVFGARPHEPEDRAPMVASTLRLATRVAPLVDIRTGNVSNAVVTEGSLVVPLSTVLAFSGGAGFLQYVPTGSAGAVTLFHTEAEVDFVADSDVTLSLGERGIWQQQNGFGTFVTTYGFLAVTLRAPRFTF
jgi:hypothetical protein